MYRRAKVDLPVLQMFFSKLTFRIFIELFQMKHGIATKNQGFDGNVSKMTFVELVGVMRGLDH